MSHSSGIPVSKTLQQSFAAALKDESRSKRFLKVKIEKDEMVQVGESNMTGDFAQDFDTIKGKLDNGPSYIVMRKDEKLSTSDAWILILYVPETSLVKEKMLYASSRDNLKKELGYSYFNEDYFASALDELSFKEYSAYKAREDVSVRQSLLTSSEKAKMEEARMEKDTVGTSEYVHGVSFPMSEAARGGLADYASGGCNWLALKVDTKGESIEFVEKKTIDNSAISDNISKTEPLFIFFKFDHENEGESKTTHVFIFSCPENSAIKAKMLFSSSKSAVLGVAASNKIDVTKKVEIREPEEVSEETLLNDLYPKSEKKVSGISKPKAAGAGSRRLIKKTEKDANS